MSFLYTTIAIQEIPTKTAIRIFANFRGLQRKKLFRNFNNDGFHSKASKG